MKIDATVKNEQYHYGDIINSFKSDAENLGVLVEFKHPPKEEFELAGPSAYIGIHIDPETLRQIFEYIAALIVIYKSSNYFGEFFKACAKKIGEITGAKVTELISGLWRQLINRVAKIQKEDKDSRMYFSLEMNIDDVPICANNAIMRGHIDRLSENDIEQTFNLLIFKVLPTLKEFVSQSNKNHIKLKDVRAELYYFETPSGIGPWHWRIKVWPIGEFMLDPHGTLEAYPIKIPLFRRIWTFLKKRKFMRKEVNYGDIEVIVKEYKRRTPP